MASTKKASTVYAENVFSSSPGHIAVFTRVKDTYTYRAHTHKGFSEIVYCVQGCFTHGINGLKIEQYQREFMLVREKDTHLLSGNDFAFINVAFENKLGRNACRFLGLKRNHFSEKNSPSPEKHRVDESSHSYLMKTAGKISAADDNKKSARIIKELLVHLLVNYFCETGIKNEMPKAPEWLVQGLGKIKKEFNPNFSAADVSRLCRKCPEHVCRMLKKHLGMTPSAFINSLKLETARRLLAETDRSVTEIALDAGFDNPGYFHRIFKKSFGVTPRKYRLQNSVLPLYASTGQA